MDTKERRRRLAGNAKPTAKTRRSTDSRRQAAKKPAERRRTAPAVRRSTSAATKEDRRRRSAAARQRRKAEARVVKPPREDIPEVVYTMPQPFRRGRFLLKLISVVAVVMALMMAVSIFFKVDTVTVTGADKYTPWMVSQASGINEGDSLLGISKARVAGKIINELNYVDKVKIRINLPGTVNIEIKELEVVYAIQARDASWWLITSEGRALEQITTTAATGYTRILGVQADAPRENQTVLAAEEIVETEPIMDTSEDDGSGLTIPTTAVITGAQRLDVALSILQNLEANGIIGQVASVNVEDLTDLTMEYGQRFHVILGTTDRLDYKIRYMARAISQMEEYQSGELDVSFEFSNEALLTPAS